MNTRKRTGTLQRLLARRTKDEVVLHTWQFELARRIAQILEEQDLTQTELARRTGLTHAQISALLHSNSNPTLSTLAKIAGYLDVQVLSFINTDDGSERERADSVSRRKKGVSPVAARKIRRPRTASVKKKS